jgi:hypothetical protein
MIAETRTTKALRDVAFALTSTLTGAASMTNSSVSQAQTSSLSNFFQCPPPQGLHRK